MAVRFDFGGIGARDEDPPDLLQISPGLHLPSWTAFEFSGIPDRPSLGDSISDRLRLPVSTRAMLGGQPVGITQEDPGPDLNPSMVGRVGTPEWQAIQPPPRLTPHVSTSWVFDGVAPTSFADQMSPIGPMSPKPPAPPVMSPKPAQRETLSVPPETVSRDFPSLLDQFKASSAHLMGLDKPFPQMHVGPQGLGVPEGRAGLAVQGANWAAKTTAEGAMQMQDALRRLSEAEREWPEPTRQIGEATIGADRPNKLAAVNDLLEGAMKAGTIPMAASMLAVESPALLAAELGASVGTQKAVDAALDHADMNPEMKRLLSMASGLAGLALPRMATAKLGAAVSARLRPTDLALEMLGLSSEEDVTLAAVREAAMREERQIVRGIRDLRLHPDQTEGASPSATPALQALLDRKNEVKASLLYLSDHPPDSTTTTAARWTQSIFELLRLPGLAPTAASGEAAPSAAKEPRRLTTGDAEASTETPARQYSSTQIDLPASLSKKVRELADTIPDEALAEKGREDKPHTTLTFGLDPDVNVADVRAVLEREPPITVELGSTSVFPASESGNGDVVKIDVDSPDLHRLNAKIREALPTTTTHPDYVPHSTVAYVQKGLGEQFAGNDALKGERVTIDHVTLSRPDGSTVEIPLKGAPPTEAATPAYDFGSIAAAEPVTSAPAYDFAEIAAEAPQSEASPFPSTGTTPTYQRVHTLTGEAVAAGRRAKPNADEIIVQTGADGVKIRAVGPGVPKAAVAAIERGEWETGRPLSVAPFDDQIAPVRRELRRMVQELDAAPFQQGVRLEGAENDIIPGRDAWTEQRQSRGAYEAQADNPNLLRNTPGARVYHDLGGETLGTRTQVQRAIQKYAEGGKPTKAAIAAVRVATRRLGAPARPLEAPLSPADMPHEVAGSAVGDEIYPVPQRWGRPDAATELAAIRYLDTHRDTLRQTYLQRFGPVYNTDSASQLFDVHGPDRRWANHDAVRSSAGALAMDLYDRAIARQSDSPSDEPVRILGGGTGSGKSTVAGQPETPFYATLDTTMKSYAQTRRALDAAVRSDRPVVVDLVYRQPIDALLDGTLARAREAGNPNEGRPVSLDFHARSHVQAVDTFLRLAQEHGADLASGFTPDGKVWFRVWDNTGPELAQSDLKWLSGRAQEYADVHALEADLRTALAGEVRAGRLDAATVARLVPDAGDVAARGRDLRAPDAAPRARGLSQPEAQGPPPPRQVDRLSTGELQSRLPGDVGAVRDQEVATPPVAALPPQSFSLTAPIETDHSQPLLADTKEAPPAVPVDGNASGHRLEAAVIPGASALYEQDIKPVAQGLARIVAEARGIIAPQSATPESQRAADVVRKAKAEAVNAPVIDRLKHEVTLAGRLLARIKGEPVPPNYLRHFERRTDDQNIANIAAYERTGRFPDAPAAYSELYQQTSALARAMLQHAYGDNEVGYIENYVRRAFLFDNAAEEAKGTEYLTGKRRSLAANKSAIKGRILDMPLDEALQEMRARGIKVKPTSTNPEVLRQWTLENAHQASAMADARRELEDLGLLVFVPSTVPGAEALPVLNVKASGPRRGRAPEGYVPIDERGMAAFAPKARGLGQYYAEPEVARVLNNATSKGLGGSAIFQGIRAINNSTNQLQLGLSAFHLTGTAVSAGLVDAVNGIRQIIRWDAKGIAALARAQLLGVSAARFLVRGRRFIEGLRHDDPAAWKILNDQVNPSGGRLQMDSRYRNEMVKSLTKALRSGNVVGATWRLPFAVTEMTSKWLMEYVIPRIKLGVLLDRLADVRERYPDASQAELHRRYAAAADQIDNKFGLLVYDNGFWDKTAQDLAQVSTRSVGWTGGSLRWGVGAVADIPKALKGDVSDRVLDALMLPVFVGLLGAVYMYLHTGKRPQSVTDLYHPENGRMDDRGVPSRTSLPTYMKDAYHYGTNPASTLLHKQSPIVNEVWALASNSDYWGDMIRDPHDPVSQQLTDAGRYLLEQNVPFTFTQAQRAKKEGASQGARAEAFFGFTSAPRSVTDTEAEKLLHEYTSQSRGARTPAQVAKSRQAADLRGEMRAGDQAGVQALVGSGQFSPRQIQDARRRARLTGLQSGFQSLSLAQALDVYEVATPEERGTVKAALAGKASRGLLNVPAVQRPALIQRLNAVRQLPATSAVPVGAAR